MTLFAALVTFLCVHPLTHDGMQREDQEFRQYLEAHGWDTSRMGIFNSEEMKNIKGAKTVDVVA